MYFFFRMIGQGSFIYDPFFALESVIYKVFATTKTIMIIICKKTFGKEKERKKLIAVTMTIFLDIYLSFLLLYYTDTTYI